MERRPLDPNISGQTNWSIFNQKQTLLFEEKLYFCHRRISLIFWSKLIRKWSENYCTLWTRPKQKWDFIWLTRYRHFSQAPMAFKISIFRKKLIMSSLWCLCWTTLAFINLATFASQCQFPKSWQGTWYHSGFPHPLNISTNHISSKGTCLQQSGSMYILNDR